MVYWKEATRGLTTAVRPLVHERDQSGARRTVADEFLAFFAVVLGGYALGSKGFSYLGFSPVYIGEISLVFGLVALWCTHTIRHLLRAPLVRLLLLFMAFGALRTLPFVQQYGLLALRDAVLWGYGVFSIVITGVIVSRPSRLSSLLSRYRRFVPVFLVGAPIMWLGTIVVAQLAQQTGVSVPVWPGTAVPLLLVKAGDLLVHLAGVAAFLAVGLAGRTRPWQTVLLMVGVGLTGMSRGGLLAFSLAFGAAFLTHPRSRGGWRLATLAVLAIAILGITGLSLRLPGGSREVSFRQLVSHVETTAGMSADNLAAQDLENTKQWRLAWWAVIVSYTIGGDYRWTGKGYGVNLATEDGFQSGDDESLRSPHNVSMTVLARSGVIGLLLWMVLQGAWFTRMLRAMRDARRTDQRHWYALFGFLIAYWIALLVNGTFDVYIEGPAGGIWFWSVFGIGIAAELLYRSGEPLVAGR